MLLLKDLVKFGGPGADPARYGSRSGPWIVFIANAAKKEGVFPKVVIGSIPVIRLIFPIACSQVDCCWFFFVTCHTVAIKDRLNQTGKTERIGALNIGLDF